MIDHSGCLGARGIKEVICFKCGKKGNNYANGANLCHSCSTEYNLCPICGKSKDLDLNKIHEARSLVQKFDKLKKDIDDAKDVVGVMSVSACCMTFDKRDGDKMIDRNTTLKNELLIEKLSKAINKECELFIKEREQLIAELLK